MIGEKIGASMSPNDSVVTDSRRRNMTRKTQKKGEAISKVWNFAEAKTSQNRI